MACRKKKAFSWLVICSTFRKLKAGIGSLFLVSSNKNSLITFHQYCNSASLKEHKTSAPLLGSVFRLSKMKNMRDTFRPITDHVGCSVLHFLATGDITTDLLAVKTSYMPDILILPSGDSTSLVAGDTVSQLELSSDRSVYNHFILS